MLKTKEEIQAWLDEMRIKNYTINDDLTVDVDGTVKISNKKLVEIPVQFGIVVRDFDCSRNKLTSLKGSPRECVGFYCSHNKLTSLVGAPQKCWYFNCSNNKLTSLEFAPKECTEFDCYNNKLTTLKFVPKECREIHCYNNKLTSLEGAPKSSDIISDFSKEEIEAYKNGGKIKESRLSKFRKD